MDQKQVKMVAFDDSTGEHLQLVAEFVPTTGTWAVREYDDSLHLMEEVETGCRSECDVREWMHKKYDILNGLIAHVYRNELGDCTNDGISASRNTLYILTTEKMPFEPEDIRQCVWVEMKEYLHEPYVVAKPMFKPWRHYMSGGNYLYTTDSRFEEITGVRYPIPIHDRYEESERRCCDA